MATWFCYGCQEDIGDAEYCPYCGMHRSGEEQEAAHSSIRPNISASKVKKVKQPIFSEEECFLYGIHPNDETYRKTMELDILSKNYKA